MDTEQLVLNQLKQKFQTIENALDKVLLLRGVEYNDIRIEPDKKKLD